MKLGSNLDRKNIFYFPIAKKNPTKLYDTNTYNLSKSDTDFVVL